ncbi:MAG: antibiotic biosynthesis monooxygenase [Bryobacteraceae bacterium]|nr:antibiotic biosynthesis monooxygenase [Bryobacteraceae bacterium]
MADKELVVFAEVYAKQGQEENLRQALMALVAPTRAEAGCLQYDLHADNDDAGHYFFYERWESMTALEAHTATAHFKAFEGRTEELLREPLRVILATRIA